MNLCSATGVRSLSDMVRFTVCQFLDTYDELDQGTLADRLSFLDVRVTQLDRKLERALRRTEARAKTGRWRGVPPAEESVPTR